MSAIHRQAHPLVAPSRAPSDRRRLAQRAADAEVRVQAARHLRADFGHAQQVGGAALQPNGMPAAMVIWSPGAA